LVVIEMKYSDVLRFYLDKQGISQAELSRKIGHQRSTVNSLLMNRAKEPTLSTAKEIADALGVSLEEMANMVFDEEENDAPGGEK
jgi:transcriptional regulator with XRE-family HTH domain